MAAGRRARGSVAPIRRVFLVQPIHPAGIERLREAGLAVRQATAADTPTVVREIGAAQVAVTRNAGLAGAAIDAAPELRLIAVHGVGYDRVDMERAAARGILVCNTPAANAQSVAEHAIALMLALARRLPAGDRAVRAGAWRRRYAVPVEDLSRKTLGIVGCGRIGLRTAALARRGLGMRVLGYSPSADPSRLRRRGIEPCAELRSLLERAEVVSLHAGLRPGTEGLIGRRELGRMRPGAILVNTARAALVDEAALVEALREGQLGGAALDVFWEEPPPAGHPLLALDNVVLTPHVAGSSTAALEATALAVAEAILRAAAGRRPAHVLSAR